MSPENQAQFEYHKMQLIGSLTTLAGNMRDCANVAEQYAHVIAGVPYMANPAAPFPTLANGQYAMPVMAPMGQDEQGKKRKSRGDDSEAKRRAKKPKDPNAPKRPASSYLLFQNDVRNELKTKNPGMRNNELLSAIAKLWAEMPQDQKDAYENRNKVLKDQWRANKAAYESGKAGASAVPVAASPPAAVAAPAVVKTVLVTTPAAEEESSGEDTSGEDEGSSTDSSQEDEEASAPPPKKSKKEDVVVVAVKEEVAASKKEKKHKKSKA